MRKNNNSGLTLKNKLIIVGFAVLVFSASVWLSLTLGDFFASYIGPVY